ncbi:MAG: hypothetical protein IJA60_05440 [Clostridia bacterium]|nr:hypothetical protein [Clostridia bacterium]
MSLNISEAASFVATAAAKDARSKGFFTSDMPLDPYLPNIMANGVLDGVLEENRALCTVKLAAESAAYLADFCGKVTSALKSTARLKPTPALFAEHSDIKLGGKVAFAEANVLANAFAVFKKKDQRLSASYVRSFTDACEDVAADNCDYCILPIENSREGALLTVYRLIERYELFIARVCSVESDELSTKFALLCHGFHGIIENTGKQYIDLRLSGRDRELWSRINVGADVLGVEMIKTVSVPFVYTDGYAHICTFYGSGEELFAFLLFLSTMRADYTLIGVYGE